MCKSVNPERSGPLRVLIQIICLLLYYMQSLCWFNKSYVTMPCNYVIIFTYFKSEAFLQLGSARPQGCPSVRPSVTDSSYRQYKQTNGYLDTLKYNLIRSNPSWHNFDTSTVHYFFSKMIKFNKSYHGC